jgi:hypothetical protein
MRFWKAGDRAAAAESEAPAKDGWKLGCLKSSAESALVLDIFRLGYGGANSWASVASHHSGGHARPPSLSQNAATPKRVL